eukprot:61885-Pelagomonas_calceolata.AAC.2
MEGKDPVVNEIQDFSCFPWRKSSTRGAKKADLTIYREAGDKLLFHIHLFNLLCPLEVLQTPKSCSWHSTGCQDFGKAGPL